MNPVPVTPLLAVPRLPARPPFRPSALRARVRRRRRLRLFLAWLRTWPARRRAEAELRCLDGLALADLGLDRGGIAAAVRGRQGGRGRAVPAVAAVIAPAYPGASVVDTGRPGAEARPILPSRHIRDSAESLANHWKAA